MKQLVNEKETDTTNDYFDVKLAEADNAIKNGAKFYSREEVDKILSTIIKNYYIFFYVEEDIKEIVIARLVYVGRNLNNIEL